MISNLVYLVQTDTTVGFLSSDKNRLFSIKNRSKTKKILRAVDSFNTLKKYTRVPKGFRKKVRNSKNITFIYPNKESFRVICHDSHHYNFISKFKIIYSTSANKSGENFNKKFAINNSDAEVINNLDYITMPVSKIYQLSKNRIKKIR